MKTICRQCAKEFNVKPAVLKIGKGATCSRRCAANLKIARNKAKAIQETSKILDGPHTGDY